jgi:hypothetical protein
LLLSERLDQISISEEISDADATATSYYNSKSKSKIARGTSSVKVSWQVTGICKDRWANATGFRSRRIKLLWNGAIISKPLWSIEEKGINCLLFPEGEKWQEQLANKDKLFQEDSLMPS